MAAAALASVAVAPATGLTTTRVLLGQARAERDAKGRALAAARDAGRRAEAGFSGATEAVDRMLTQVALGTLIEVPGPRPSAGSSWRTPATCRSSS